MPYLKIDKFKTGIIDTNLHSAIELPPDAASDIRNVDFWPKGSISVREGYRSVFSSAWAASDAKIARIWEHEAASTYTPVVFAASATGTSGHACILAFASSACTITTLCATDQASAWGPTNTDVISCTTFANSGWFAYGGTLQLVNWYPSDGYMRHEPTLSAQTSAYGVRTVCNWGNYLFLGNMINGGSRDNDMIRWCYPGNPKSWPISYYIQLDQGDGDEITGMGLVRGNLAVFKKTKTYVVRWVGGNTLFTWNRITPDIGCVGQNSIVQFENLLYFAGTKGFYAFDGEAPPVEISAQIRTHFSLMDATFYKHAFTLVDASKRKIWFFVPFTQSSTALSYINRVYVYDLDLQNWTIFEPSHSLRSAGKLHYGFGKRLDTLEEPTGSKEWSYYTGRISDFYPVYTEDMFFGGLAGQTYKYGGVATDDGTPFTSYWKSIWHTFDNPIHNKRIRRVSALIDPYGTSTALASASYITLRRYDDWDDTTIQDTMNLVTSGTSQILEKRFDFTHYLRAMKIEFRSSSAVYDATANPPTYPGAPWVIHQAHIDWLPKGRTSHWDGTDAVRRDHG